MNDLLNNPAVQAAVVPFIVALLLGFALAGTRYLVLAVASGLVVVLALTIGFSMEPFTAVKKLIVAVFATVAVAMAFEAAGAAARRPVIAALAVAAGLAAVWVPLRVILQMESTSPWLAGLGAFALATATTATSVGAARGSPLRASVVGACLGWGSGVLALLGASALLAQIGMAIGSASAAVALVQMVRGREAPLGWTLVMPAAVAAAIVGVLASSTGELRWYCLIPLPLVPVATLMLRPSAKRRAWQTALVTGVAAMAPVVIAVGLAWASASSSSAAG